MRGAELLHYFEWLRRDGDCRARRHCREKLWSPERRVIAVTGDGGFLMNSQELETAVRLGLPLVILVWRDDGYR